MTRLISKRVGSEDGQSLVEFSLSVFLLVMLLIGVVEISRMLLVYTTIANAARVGVRYAIVNGKDVAQPPSPTVNQVVTSYLGAAPLNTGVAGLQINVIYSDATNKSVGSTVTVQVVYPYDPFTSYFPLQVNLGSTSQGVITF